MLETQDLKMIVKTIDEITDNSISPKLESINMTLTNINKTLAEIKNQLTITKNTIEK